MGERPIRKGLLDQRGTIATTPFGIRQSVCDCVCVVYVMLFKKVVLN